MASTRVVTDEDLLRLPEDGGKYEVVDGALVHMSPASWEHERLVARLIARLGAFVEANRLGVVLGSNAMYVLPSGNRRSPDVSYVSTERLPALTAGSAFPAVAPDLAVEVVSPGDAPRAILDKVGEYLEAGVRLVWVIDPVQRTATSHRSLTDVRGLGEADTLSGEPVLIGFTCPLAELLG